MQTHVRFWMILSAVFALPALAAAHNPVEPTAGSWRTWVIPSAADYRAPAPPGASQTQAELREVSRLLTQNGPDEQAQIAYWDAGAPAYRWMGLLHARSDANQPLSTYPARLYAYVAIAMYDATIATWESKYHYQRLRPSEIRRNLPVVLTVPESPSYPSEHAVAAGVASVILGELLPAEAAQFQELAEEAARWEQIHEATQPLLGDVGEFWAERARSTGRLLAALL